jgi:hypothetical protein
LEIREADYFGYRKKEFIAKEEPEVERFNTRELALLDEVISFVCENNTAKTISEFSHSKPWEIAEYGDVLPYHSALLLFPTQVSLEAFDWASAQVNEIETITNIRPLEVKSSADLRSRLLQARRAG